MLSPPAEPRPMLWTRDSFYRLSQAGYFDGRRVQLVEGRIIEMPPQKHAHAYAVSLIADFLRCELAEEYWVREGKPLNLDAENDPEPDVAVVPGKPWEHKDHPASAALIVEVADSSLKLDQRKTKLYATHGVEEYWIVDLSGRRVEIHRKPLPERGEYESTTVVAPPQKVSPLVKPSATFGLASLFV